MIAYAMLNLHSVDICIDYVRKLSAPSLNHCAVQYAYYIVCKVTIVISLALYVTVYMTALKTNSRCQS